MTENAPPDAPNPSDVPPDSKPSAEPAPEAPRTRVFGRFAFWIVVFPFLVYLIGMQTGSYLEKLRIAAVKGELDELHSEEGNRPPKDEVDVSTIEVPPEARFLFVLPLGKNSYPYTYTATIGLTTLCMLLFGWGYFRAPFRISPLSVVVGIVGIVVWIGLTYVDRNFIGLAELLSGGRTAFNPYEELKDDPSWLQRFMAIRFFGLVVVVPIVEEFFVRAFLIRYVDDPDWDELPLGQAKTLGWLSPTIYGVVAHLTEPLAALAWFSMVTWLYKRTGSVWDCVVAHAITNLLLGIYVVKFDAWYLW